MRHLNWQGIGQRDGLGKNRQRSRKNLAFACRLAPVLNDSVIARINASRMLPVSGFTHQAQRKLVAPYGGRRTQASRGSIVLRGCDFTIDHSQCAG